MTPETRSTPSNRSSRPGPRPRDRPRAGHRLRDRDPGRGHGADLLRAGRRYDLQHPAARHRETATPRSEPRPPADARERRFSWWRTTRRARGDQPDPRPQRLPGDRSLEWPRGPRDRLRPPGKIDLLVTDVIMPQMLGKESRSRCRQSSPDIKVIFMSGYAGPVLAGRLLPDVALVEKPFSEADLRGKTGQVLNGHFRGFETVGGPRQVTARRGRDVARPGPCALGREPPSRPAWKSSNAWTARPWCSSRTGRTRRPARRSAGRRARAPRGPACRAVLALASARTHQESPGAEHRQLAGAHRPPLGADGARAREHVDERVEVRAPGQLELGAGCDGGVHQRDRGVGDAGAGVAADIAGDDPQQRAAVG